MVLNQIDLDEVWNIDQVGINFETVPREDNLTNWRAQVGDKNIRQRKIEGNGYIYGRL